jgi:hypothetical protein
MCPGSCVHSEVRLPHGRRSGPLQEQREILIMSAAKGENDETPNSPKLQHIRLAQSAVIDTTCCTLAGIERLRRPRGHFRSGVQ